MIDEKTGLMTDEKKFNALWKRERLNWCGSSWTRREPCSIFVHRITIPFRPNANALLQSWYTSYMYNVRAFASL